MFYIDPLLWRCQLERRLKILGSIDDSSEIGVKAYEISCCFQSTGLKLKISFYGVKGPIIMASFFLKKSKAFWIFFNGC